MRITEASVSDSATETLGTLATTEERLLQARSNALGMMRKAGFEIRATVHTTVDPELPFMGYTFPEGRDFKIVVSGMALESGLVEGLLVHELSHVYRMLTNHPSHNGRIIEDVIRSLGKRALSQDYEERIIHDLVNHIQDLYADDIAFKVFRGSEPFPMDRVVQFLQDWVKEEPEESDDARRNQWVNAAIMVNNARVLAQMVRHGIEDIGGRATASSQGFLSRVSPATSGQFEYFRALMTNLKEDISEREYRRLLTSYLKRFLETAEGNDEAPEAPGQEQWTGGLEFNNVLEELDRSETRLTVRVESRRWGKPVTIIQGLPKTGPALEDAARGLKEQLATGGTVKDGLIMLQGDHRARIRTELGKIGFPGDHIEVR